MPPPLVHPSIIVARRNAPVPLANASCRQTFRPERAAWNFDRRRASTKVVRTEAREPVMTEIKTNVAQVRFLVEEEAGRCFVRLQQQHVPGIPMLRYGSLRLDLADGVTRQEAEEIAGLLNRRVHSIVYAGEDLVEKRSIAEGR